MIVIGAVLLALFVFGGIARLLSAAGDAAAPALAVGDCITDTAYGDAAAELTAPDCTDANAVFELTAAGTSQTCPDGQTGAASS